MWIFKGNQDLQLTPPILRCEMFYACLPYLYLFLTRVVSFDLRSLDALISTTVFFCTPFRH